MMKTLNQQAENIDWTIVSVIELDINVAKYNPLSGSSYIKLPKELNHLRKGLMNIQHVDDNGVKIVFRQIFESCRPSSRKNQNN